jgi:hypothetical protein
MENQKARQCEPAGSASAAHWNGGLSLAPSPSVWGRPYNIQVMKRKRYIQTHAKHFVCPLTDPGAIFAPASFRPAKAKGK